MYIIYIVFIYYFTYRYLHNFIHQRKYTVNHFEPKLSVILPLLENMKIRLRVYNLIALQRRSISWNGRAIRLYFILCEYLPLQDEN